MCAVKIKRRISWTKHTNYTSLNGPAAEVSTAVTAGNKSMEQQLVTNQSIITSIGRKSISRIEYERRKVEKSMIAYSKKVKDITDTRTNDLFREIHNRNSYRANIARNAEAGKELEVGDTATAKHRRGTGLMLKQIRALELRVRSPDEELSMISEAMTTITEPWSHATDVANSVKLKSILRRSNSANAMERNKPEDENEDTDGPNEENKAAYRDNDSSAKQIVKFAESQLVSTDPEQIDDVQGGKTAVVSKKQRAGKKDTRNKSALNARKIFHPIHKDDTGDNDKGARSKYGRLEPKPIPVAEKTEPRKEIGQHVDHNEDELDGNESAGSYHGDSSTSDDLPQASIKANNSVFKKRRFVKKRQRKVTGSKGGEILATSATPLKKCEKQIKNVLLLKEPHREKTNKVTSA